MPRINPESLNPTRLQNAPADDNPTPGARVLFLYPNERGMSTVPAAIAILSQLLKDAGHETSLFDTTFYKFDDELAITGFSGEKTDQVMVQSLNYRPVDDPDSEDYFFKKSTSLAVDDFRDVILEFRPDLIAVSCTETIFKRALSLIHATRDLKVPNIFGGVFSTFAPELVLSHNDIDMVCVGEGENTLVELANCIAAGRDFSQVTNLWYRTDEGKTQHNPITHPVNVNELPTITDIGIFGEKRFYRPLGGKIRRLLPVETHRGCPYTCSFCNSPSQSILYADKGSFFRKKSIDLVRREIENHIAEWKVEYIYFWADTFLAWSNQEFDEFCDMYSDIKLPFWCQTRTETVTEYRLKRLKDVGLDRISFGVEHGNENFRREVVNRDYSNEDAVRSLDIVSSLEIPFAVNNIIGFPDETRELAFDTIELNRKFKSDTVLCQVFVPFNGTPLRKYAEEKGYIDSNAICSESGADVSYLNMPSWESNDISRLRNVFAMYVKFPKERWPEIAQAETDPEIFAQLSEEFVEMCWSNPRGRIEQDLADAAKGIF